MTPEFARFQQTFNDAVPQGLVAAAAIYHGALRAKLQRGYTSGDFTTGNVSASVQMDAGSQIGGEWEVAVGTNLMYALYWEMGHQNVFTRRYERVEHWRETAEEEGDAMAAAFGAVVATRLEAGQ